MRRAGRTDGAAVDARGLDAREEAPVKAGIARGDGAITGVVIEFHGSELTLWDMLGSRFSDIIGFSRVDSVHVRKPPDDFAASPMLGGLE